jgi:hypothetical protein
MSESINPKSMRMSREVKVAAYEIIYEAMICTQAAFNASLAILEMTHDDIAFDAADESAEALNHLARAARRIYKMPVAENS